MFSPNSAWDAHHSGRCDGGMGVQRFFDFPRGNVLAAFDNQVLLAVGYIDESVRVGVTYVTCPQISVRKDSAGGFRIAPPTQISPGNLAPSGRSSESRMRITTPGAARPADPTR